MKKNEEIKKEETTVMTVMNEQVQDRKVVLNHFNQLTRNIRSEMKKTQTSFFKIGFALCEIYEESLYSVSNAEYRNIYDYAAREFQISRGTCNNFIQVAQQFGKRVDGKIVPELRDEYKSFTSSQLLALKDAAPELVSEVAPEMSVREIKRKVKESKSNTGKDTSSSASSDKSDEDNVIDVDSKTVNTQLVGEVYSYDDIAQFEAVIRKFCNDEYRKEHGHEYRLRIDLIWD